MACFYETYVPQTPHDVKYDPFGPSYADLPTEMLVKIFSYLTPWDRREAGLTCHRWSRAAHDTALLDRYWLVLDASRFVHPYEPPVRMLLASFRFFQNVELRRVQCFDRLGSFFRYFGQHIRRINFNGCQGTERQYFDILRHLSGLRSLSLRHSRVRSEHPIMLLFQDPAERAELRRTLSRATELSLDQNYCLSFVFLHRLIAVMPSLSSLHLKRYNIEINLGDPGRPSEDVLAIQYISQVLDERKALLRLSVDFNGGSIIQKDMEALAAMGPNLHLERLDLAYCSLYSANGLQALLRAQSAHLQHLNLSKLRFNVGSDSLLSQICHKLPRLRVLKLCYFNLPYNQSVREMPQLTQLQVLDLSCCNEPLTEFFIKGIASKKNDTMRELHLQWHLSEQTIFLITENLPKLRVLHMATWLARLTDHFLQLVFRKLVHLKRLDVVSFMISDFGLTGMDKLEMQRNMQAAGASTGVPPTPEPREAAGNGHEIAQLKPSAQPTAKLESSSAAYCGYSIERLQQLQVLKLDFCVNLTNASLFHLRFPELYELSLSGCLRITNEGIQALVRGCPAIEKLALSGCNINDEAVRLIVLHLRRLRWLHLSGCPQVTNVGMSYITSRCNGPRITTVLDYSTMNNFDIS